MSSPGPRTYAALPGAAAALITGLLVLGITCGGCTSTNPSGGGGSPEEPAQGADAGQDTLSAPDADRGGAVPPPISHTPTSEGATPAAGGTAPPQPEAPTTDLDPRPARDSADRPEPADEPEPEVAAPLDPPAEPEPDTATDSGTTTYDDDDDDTDDDALPREATTDTPAERPTTPTRPEPRDTPQPAPVKEVTAPARPTAPPEDVILARNMWPGDKNRYSFDLAEARVTKIEPAGGGVQLTLASGRQVRVPANGKPVLDSLRDNTKPIKGNTYHDVLAGYFIVAGLNDPTKLNDVIKGVDAYPSYFQKKDYKFSWYEGARSVAVGSEQARRDASKRDVLSKLAPYGFDVQPSDSRFVLEIIIGHGNWVEKAEVTLEMSSTSYVMREGGKVVRIVNENSFVSCPRGDTKDQAVVWVLQAVPGVGTLARYYQASETVYEGGFKDKRLELTEQNIVHYMQGIHDRAAR